MENLPQPAQNLVDKALEPISTFEINGLIFTPNYLHAAVVVFLIFVLILTLARLRRMYVNWSLRGSLTMIAFGFILAIIAEGFLILGGRTIFTELLGWENPPKPVETALDKGRERLVNTLGVNQEIPISIAEEPVTAEKAMSVYQSLPEEEAEEFKQILCSPE